MRDKSPTSPACGRSGRGPNIGTQAVEFRIVMVALAEEKRVAGAVGDIFQTNATANEEDSIAGHSGKIRSTARLSRAFATVSAITCERVETPRPREVAFRVLRDRLRQWIRWTEQDLDDLGLGGIAASGNVVAVVVVVPVLVQIILLDI